MAVQVEYGLPVCKLADFDDTLCGLIDGGELRIQRHHVIGQRTHGQGGPHPVQEGVGVVIGLELKV